MPLYRVILVIMTITFSPFSPFLTISLCRAGQHFIHPVFSILCHVFSQLLFRHVSLYVVPPSLFRSASVPSPRNLLAISHRCGCVLASSQTNLVFCCLGNFNGFYVRLLPGVFTSDVIQPGLPSCPSQQLHFG